jgi:hypothetical protein
VWDKGAALVSSQHHQLPLRYLLLGDGLFWRVVVVAAPAPGLLAQWLALEGEVARAKTPGEVIDFTESVTLAAVSLAQALVPAVVFTSPHPRPVQYTFTAPSPL